MSEACAFCCAAMLGTQDKSAFSTLFPVLMDLLTLDTPFPSQELLQFQLSAEFWDKP